MRNAVVLPHPEGLSSAMNERSGTFKSSECRAVNVSNVFRTPW